MSAENSKQTGWVHMVDITSMMIRRDDRTLNLPTLKSVDATAFQIAYTIKHLPYYLQPVRTSDADKLHAFLATFFTKTMHPKGYGACYAYQIQHTHGATNVTLLAQKQPETPDDFFALALAINNHAQDIMVCDDKGEPADALLRKMFIYSLLQEAALCGHAQAAKVVGKLTADAEANNYNCKSRFDYLYSYKNTHSFVFLLETLITPAQFFALANDANLAANVFVFHNHKILGAGLQSINELIYGLLSDAAKAGHVASNHQLIEATIAGNASARQFVTFEKYNPELEVLLPRKWVTADDFYKLSTSLITHGKHILGNACILYGPFYIVPQGKYAERLGYQLRIRADKLRCEEEKLKKLLTDQEMVPQPKAPEPTQASEEKQWTSYAYTFFHTAEGESLLPDINAKEIPQPLGFKKA